MKLIPHIQNARDAYLAFLRECLSRARDQHDNVAAESVVRLGGPPDWTLLQRTIRVDLLWKENNEPRAAKVEIEGVLPGSAVGAMQVGSMEVLVHPVAWNFCPVRLTHAAADFSPLNDWYRKWLAEDAPPESDEFGLSGVVHSLSPPMREGQGGAGGAGWLLLVDFGSAPTDALVELLQALQTMGATDVKIGAALAWELKRSSVEAMTGELTEDNFAAKVAQVLRTELHARVELRGPMELVVETAAGNSMRANLDNLYRMLIRIDPHARANEIRQWIALHRDQLARLAGESPPPALDDLRPMVKDQQFVDAVRQKIGPAAPNMWRRLAGDLWVVYVWDQPNGMQFLTNDDPTKHGLSLEKLHARAVENFLKSRPGIELQPEDGILAARTRDNYDASLLLDDTFWQDVSSRVRGNILACVPTRDVVLISGTGETDALNRLHNAAKKLMENGDHLVSATILLRTGTNWEVFPGHPAPSSLPPPSSITPRKKPWYKFW
jgi:hypothetical protein